MEDKLRRAEEKIAKLEAEVEDKPAARPSAMDNTDSVARVKKLEKDLVSQKESHRREQDLMMSSFYEIGLRYQQLLSEYRFVLLDTGREDNLRSEQAGG